MARRKHNDALTIREIEYSILIKDKDKGFDDVVNILQTELTRFEDTRKRKAKQENPIREFLKTNIERSIVIRDNTRVYFVDYQEKGSFTFQFTVLLITRYINYGTTRQALDYLIKDTIGDYFEELLERHLPVSVSVHSVDTELYEIPDNYNSEYAKPGQQHDFLPILLASIALLFTLALGFIWILPKKQPAEINQPTNEYRDKYFELLIEKQVNEAFDKEKLNFVMYKNLVSASDSSNNIYNQPKR
jgi:hypothetical protein